MNEQERVEKFKKLPEEIQNKILNSSEEELKNFLKLSHFERDNLDIPASTRKDLRKIFNLGKEKNNFDDYEDELYDLLMNFGLTLSKNKLNQLSKKVELNFEKVKRKKKIIKFKKSTKKSKKKVKISDNHIKYYKSSELVTVYSIYGKIKQPMIRYDPKSKYYSSIRPASEFTGIKSGYATRKLKEVITDFSLDNSFENVNLKLEKHYGLELDKGKIKSIVYNIASYVESFYESLYKSFPSAIKPAKKLEIQLDGVYGPIVQYNPKKKIGEKDRVKIRYKEIKHIMVKISSDIKGFHFARIIPVENIKDFFKEFNKILLLKGYSKETEIFVISDGAVWIEKQLSNFFKDNKFNFIIDFYHLLEYIYDAVKSLPSKYFYLIKRWKKAAKKGKLEETIFRDIKKLDLINKSVEIIRTEKITDKNGKVTIKEKLINLVQLLQKYVKNRIGQFNYPFFRKNKMPIGSGRIESANKILIKKRMNIPFGWKLKNANLMLALLTMRHNGHWKDFWKYISNLDNKNILLEEVA